MKSRNPSLAQGTRDKASDINVFSVSLISADLSAAFHVQISIGPSQDGKQALLQMKETLATLVDEHGTRHYEISVTCIRAGETWTMSSMIRHIALPTVFHPLLEVQFICAADENHLSLGCIELDMSHACEDLTIAIRDPNEAIFQRALKSFQTRAHALKHPNSCSEAVALTERCPITRYAIFDDADIVFDGFYRSPGEEVPGAFLVNGANNVQDNRHIYQFSRRLQKKQTKNSHREAGQFEAFLCVYEETRDTISWLIHTTTAGDSSLGRTIFPETAWALHSRLPLLIWLLPGHRLRLSNIETQDPPISIAGKHSVHCSLRMTATES